MEKRYLALFSLLLTAFLTGCMSGKSAYKRGDYYEAVLTSVNRLRSNPDHKKSREILRLSYQAAVEFLETDAENQITSNANFKWANAVENYNRINRLYEEIRTSPGALRIITKPISKYNELIEIKNKAAEESYQAGIQAMLKNNRDDAKQAYFHFDAASTYSPGYREAIEMMDQAKFNATLKVVVEPVLRNLYDWNFEPVVFGYKSNLFVSMYTPQQVSNQNLERIDQFLKVSVNGYQEGRPEVSKRVVNYKDSIKSERTINSKKIITYEQVQAQMIIYEKKIVSTGSINLLIVDADNRAELRNTDLVASAYWQESWATYTGDARALPESGKRLVAKREPFMPRDYLQNKTRQELDSHLNNALNSFYRTY